MEFIFETEYDYKALTIMAKALRKTIRKKRSRISHVLGWGIILLSLLVSLPDGEEPFNINFNLVVTWAADLVILIVLLFEDKINGYFAKKHMINGTDKARCVFREDGYSSITEAGTTEWKYSNIISVAETTDYFIFIFDKNHAQIYDKMTISGGDENGFRRFISEKTSSKIILIK